MGQEERDLLKVSLEKKRKYALHITITKPGRVTKIEAAKKQRKQKGGEGEGMMGWSG